MLCETPSLSRRALLGSAGALFAWAYIRSRRGRLGAALVHGSQPNSWKSLSNEVLPPALCLIKN